MPVKIPWTISNKYYSASVHFAAHTIHGLSPHHLQNAPAVILSGLKERFVYSLGMLRGRIRS